MKKTLGLEIRKSRKQAGITATELARRLGVSRRTIGYWERGLRFPETKRILLLCNILGKNVNDFLIYKIEDKN